MKKKVLSVLAIVAAFSLTASAVAAEAPAAPKPDPALQQLKYFVGSWSCKGQAEATPWGPAHKTTAKVNAKSDLGGYFISGRYSEDRAGNPMPVDFQWTWGWDSKGKDFDAWGFDNFGSTFKQESKGWEGDKLVFAGDAIMDGKTMASRDTFTRKGDHEISHVGEIQMDGKWMKVSEETCIKAGGAAKKK